MLAYLRDQRAQGPTSSLLDSLLPHPTPPCATAFALDMVSRSQLADPGRAEVEVCATSPETLLGTGTELLGTGCHAGPPSWHGGDSERGAGMRVWLAGWWPWGLPSGAFGCPEGAQTPGGAFRAGKTGSLFFHTRNGGQTPGHSSLSSGCQYTPGR